MMLILLVLLYFPFASIMIYAAPLDNSLSNNIGFDNLVLPTCVSPPNQRTVFTIVWNCIVTIILCTWTSVHPNIQGPDEGWWEVTLQRIELMLWTLIAPEHQEKPNLQICSDLSK